jgi:hypothetical protein
MLAVNFSCSLSTCHDVVLKLAVNFSISREANLLVRTVQNKWTSISLEAYSWLYGWTYKFHPSSFPQLLQARSTAFMMPLWKSGLIVSGSTLVKTSYVKRLWVGPKARKMVRTIFMLWIAVASVSEAGGLYVTD